MELAAGLTLSLGVGAVTASYLLARTVLAPLAYPAPERLLRVHAVLEELRSATNPRLAAAWNRFPVSFQNAADWRARARSLDGLGLYQGTTVVLDTDAEPEELPAARVEPELLALLKVPPALGRSFSAEEARRGERLVLLGAELWQGRFGGDPGVLGRSLTLDGRPYSVVGVMPAGFSLPGRNDALYLPLAPDAEDLAARDDYRYLALASLAPGVRFEAAAAELGRISDDLAREHPETNRTSSVRLVPLADAVQGESRRLVAILTAAAWVVLAVAVANLAHLKLAEGLERRREVALCLALGASRGRRPALRFSPGSEAREPRAPSSSSRAPAAIPDRSASRASSPAHPRAGR